MAKLQCDTCALFMQEWMRELVKNCFMIRKNLHMPKIR
jgi:hypothetical protein